MTVSRPLDNFPVVRTLDPEEVRNALGRVYVRPTVKLAAPHGTCNAALNECQLHHVRLAYGAFGAALRFEFPAADYFLHMFPIRGRGQIVTRQKRLPLAAGVTATISPDAGFKADYDADYECLLLKIDKQALTRKLVEMTGAVIDEPLRMEPELDLSRPAAKLLHDYIPVLVDTLSGAVPPLPPWWVEQTEQLLMTMFLAGHRHNYSHLLEEEVEVACGQVRCAEEYIAAHWQEPITLDDLARVAGVSAFSLFRAFKQSRGYSPLDFVAQVRAKNGVAS
jgi:hypothetical protein